MMSPFLLVVITTLASHVCGDKPPLNISEPVCQDILKIWLWDLQAQLDETTATLTVSWSELEERLAEQNCIYNQARRE